jgi:hypothetical protein
MVIGATSGAWAPVGWVEHDVKYMHSPCSPCFCMQLRVLSLNFRFALGIAHLWCVHACSMQVVYMRCGLTQQWLPAAEPFMLLKGQWTVKSCQTWQRRAVSQRDFCSVADSGGVAAGASTQRLAFWVMAMMIHDCGHTCSWRSYSLRTSRLQ